MSSTKHIILLLAAVFVSLPGCEREIVPEAYVPTSAHDGYRHSLREADLLATALGRDWERAAERALRDPIDVDTPFRESAYVDRAEAFAAGYRFSVKRGQKTEARLTLEPSSDWRVFLDLFRAPERPEDDMVHVASGGEGDLRLAFEPRRDGDYVLRAQSELLRGGRITIEIRNVASLDFPVAGHDTTAIGSRFGAPREAGRRQHHGVDIFAPRHTEVRATARARVRRVDDWRLGGRVIWLEDRARGLRYYFAHLETQDVIEGTWVAPGDRIGTVGNSGNARTTPPHLHFGIYRRGEGPIDPYFFLYQPEAEPPPVAVELERLGRWVRTRRDTTPLTARPPARSSRADRELAPHTPLLVLGGSGRSYRVALPDGQTGFVPEGAVEDLVEPLASISLDAPAKVRDWPEDEAVVIYHLGGGEPLGVMARFRRFALVEGERGPRGWLLHPADDGKSPPPVAGKTLRSGSQATRPSSD